MGIGNKLSSVEADIAAIRERGGWGGETWGGRWTAGGGVLTVLSGNKGLGG